MKYTYFIREVESGLMKIGSSETPQSRFQNLQVSSPRDLEFVLATTLVTEKECHERFAESKIRGEWFLPGADMDAFLSELKQDAKKYPTQFFTAKAEQPTTIELDIRDLPADVQDILRDRAIKETRPIQEIVRDFALDTARLLNGTVVTLPVSETEGGAQ